MRVRDATVADAPAVAAILNWAIRDTTITFRATPVTAEDRADWIGARQAAGFAVLVAEAGDGLAGYASYGAFRAGDGYSLTVEHTIQLTEGFRGRGIGRALMAALIDRARAAGFHAMIGAVTAENAASVAFHRALGFHRAGVLPQCGHKFGRWLDLEFWQLLLDSREAPSLAPGRPGLQEAHAARASLSPAGLPNSRYPV